MLPALGDSGAGRATVGGDVTVAEGETAADVSCVFCTVHVHGEVSGNVAVAFGDVLVDSGHSIAGNVAVLGGDVELAEGATVGGNVAVMAGTTKLAPGAVIAGKQAVLPGRLWLLIPFVPLLFLVGLVWLIVWLVRRNRSRYPGYAPPMR
ncbi:MAG: hypothetical protein M3Y50_11660 [Acidobacteriota bacterium]|nr:hypothetical protein [Acidobacteriota bacterium]